MSFAAGPDESELLDLTIRFSPSLPDLLLSVSNPTISTTCRLKQLIRSHLPAELSDRRIRLIYAGKPLSDYAPLISSLRLSSRLLSRSNSRPQTPLPSQPRTPASAGFSPSPSGLVSTNLSTPVSSKGKTVIRDPPSSSRIYVHCLIADARLSERELADEEYLSNSRNVHTPSSSDLADRYGSLGQSPVPSTTPAARGFDRLLAAGFSQSEVESLRDQFNSIQAHTRTRDEMPSPNTLRELEDRWLDNSNQPTLSYAGNNSYNDNDLEGGGIGSNPSIGIGVDEDQIGALDDMLWGTIAGFFWPVGCLWWLCWEEGVWSPRRKVAVFIGFAVNLGFGGIRWLR